jgi:DNA-binding transcriptional LysR family regulator
MDLALVQAFIAVVDSGGFTRAAARLSRTQSTISAQIARLEELLGRRLLLRDTRNFALAPDGERYLPYARRLLALDAEARADLANPARAQPVRLGVIEDFSDAALPQELARFVAAHPEVRLEVLAGTSAELVARLEDGRLDLVVMKEPERRPGALSRKPIALAWRGQDGLATLRPLPLAVFPGGCALRARGTAALERAGISWRIAYESPSRSGVRGAVAAGLGVSLLEAWEAPAPLLHELPQVPPIDVVLRSRPGAGPAVAALAAAIDGLSPERVAA